MPGKHITQEQEAIYMKNRQTRDTQETAAAKSGINIRIRNGRRIEKGERPETKQRNWRTRQNPFEAVWEAEF